MNVALIDDGVAINNYTKEFVYEFLEINDALTDFNQQTSYINTASHGTVCAGIIRKMTKEARIYSLKILDDTLCGSTVKLIKALEWCLRNDMHIINLSLGTTNSKDFKAIQHYIKYLNQEGIIIVAALNNNCTYTIPASLPEVVGVCSQENFHDFELVDNSIIGIDVIACSNYWIQLDPKEGIQTPYCNSFAAPAVTGQICEILSGKISNIATQFATSLKELIGRKRQAVDNFITGNMVKIILTPKVLQDVTGSHSIKKIVPIIKVSCEDKDLYQLNQLFYNDNLFPVVLCGKSVLKKVPKKHIYQLIHRISGLTDCDLIFLFDIPVRLGKGDLFIQYDEVGIQLMYRRGFITTTLNYYTLNEVYQSILDLLV